MKIHFSFECGLSIVKKEIVILRSILFTYGSGFTMNNSVKCLIFGYITITRQC